jgi:hypothetical protein
MSSFYMVSPSIRLIKPFLNLSGILLLGLSIYMAQLQIDRSKGISQKIEGFLHLPKGEYLKVAALGYDQLLADLLWLRVIQIVGEHTVTETAYDWVYHALDVMTTLDPKFVVAYQMAGVTLSTLANQPEKANALLLKGAKENPDIWQLPFYIGFNYFFYLNDYKSAAEQMARAAQIPGRPDFLPSLATRLFVQAGEPQTALEFLTRMAEEAKDEKVREALQRRMEEILTGEVKGIFPKPKSD